MMSRCKIDGAMSLILLNLPKATSPRHAAAESFWRRYARKKRWNGCVCRLPLDSSPENAPESIDSVVTICSWTHKVAAGYQWRTTPSLLPMNWRILHIRANVSLLGIEPQAFNCHPTLHLFLLFGNPAMN